MRQRHPLENPSLTPYGFVFPAWKKRLEYKSQLKTPFVNGEVIMGRVWDRANRANAPKPLPIWTIIHWLLPSQATTNHITAGDFTHEGIPYLTRDILLLSSFLQWLGTGVGRCFLESEIWPWDLPKNGFVGEREFLIKLEIERRRWDPVAHVVHVCTADCDKVRMIRGSCYKDPKLVLPRDRAVVDGLLRWLGKPAGRAFIAEFQHRKKNAWDAARARFREQMGIAL